MAHDTAQLRSELQLVFFAAGQVRWAVTSTGESQTMVGKLVSFLGTIQELQKTSEASSTEISKKLQDLVVAILGVQSATRVSIEDGKQFQKQVNRSLENMSWQVAGAGKAQNQSLKDVTISSSRMLQGINDHLNKQNKVAEGMAETMENVESHLATLNEHMKKLIEIQQKNVTEGGKTTTVPVAPRMDSGVASTAAKAATLGTTGRAAKAMPIPPEAVPPAPVGTPLPIPPAPPQLSQGLAPPQMMDPHVSGMAMPSSCTRGSSSKMEQKGLS